MCSYHEQLYLHFTDEGSREGEVRVAEILVYSEVGARIKEKQVITFYPLELS